MLEEAELHPIPAFVASLERQGFKLWIDGAQLRVRAPQGALTLDLQAVLTERRSELMEFLGNRRPTLEITSNPDHRHAPFPLTELQRSYSLGQTGAFELGNVQPHLYCELEFARLDLDRVRRALWCIIERHDMLRSIILPSGEQVVLEQTPDWDFPCIDLTSLDDVSRDRMLQR